MKGSLEAFSTVVAHSLRRVTTLILICASDLGVPGAQPYGPIPREVPRQHPLWGH